MPKFQIKGSQSIDESFPDKVDLSQVRGGVGSVEIPINMEWSKCLTTCKGCALINKLPFDFCCLYECGEHEFCRGCNVNKKK